MNLFGWVKQKFDERDFKAKDILLEEVELPAIVDLRNSCPPILDQGHLGSCTANAISSAIDFERLKQKEDLLSPSRLFIYYNERELNNNTESDTGARIRDGIKTVSRLGTCTETLWPYIEHQFTTKPTNQCYNEAVKFKVLEYYALDNTNIGELKKALASGYPFVCGIQLFSEFREDKCKNEGILDMPGFFSSQIGGHAVFCVGYNDEEERFLIKNSWGVDWGNKGYFTIPYKYLTSADYADDFWLIKVVT